MSRVGKYPVAIPPGVEISVIADCIKAKGRNGTLHHRILSDVDITLKDDEILIAPNSDSRQARALWGTMRANIQSMITGVSVGFKRTLEIQGVGYRARIQDETLKLQLGYSHEVKFSVPDGISIECPSQTEIVVLGMDKQLVGQTAAEIRSWRPPEPYKGKGIRYKGEYVLRKESKKK